MDYTKTVFSTKIILSSIIVNFDKSRHHFSLQKTYSIECLEDINKNSNISFQYKQHFRILQKQTKRPPQTYICRKDACATKKLTKLFLWQILNSHMNAFTVSFEKSYKQTSRMMMMKFHICTKVGMKIMQNGQIFVCL